MDSALALPTGANIPSVFDRRRRDPLWKISEKVSGEDKVTKRAVELFYDKIDYLIEKRLESMRNGYKPNPDAGVDLLDLFMQSTTDKYTLGGMVYSFLSAGRKCQPFKYGVSTNEYKSRGYNDIQHVMVYDGNPSST